MDNGSRIRPDQWYSGFKQKNREVFGCGWGVRAFRQGAIAMAREFISPNDAFAMAEDLLAEGADHSTDIDKEHYGLVYGSIPELTNNTMSKHRWLNEEWQAFCGLGPFPPQAPIRQTRTRSAHTPGAYGGGAYSADLAGMSEAMSTISSSVVTKFLQENLPHLLKDLVTTNIVPPILDALQQDAARFTVAQNHTVTSHKSSSGMTPARTLGDVHVRSRGMCLPSCVPYEMLFIYGIARDIFQSSQSGRDTDKEREPSDLGRSVNVTTGASGFSACPSQSSISTFTPTPAHRKRNRATESPSLLDSDDDWLESPSKRIRPASYLSQDQLSDIMLPDDDEDDRDPQHLLTPSSSQQHYIPPSDQDLIKSLDHSSSALASEWKERVRKAFQLLFKDPAAKEKSTEQLNAIVSVMTIQLDILVTLKTGGGKSALWMIAPLIDASQRCIVVCPFVVLLEEQVRKCCAAGLRAHNFTKNKVVPDDVQILFLQVETCSAMAFQE